MGRPRLTEEEKEQRKTQRASDRRKRRRIQLDYSPEYVDGLKNLARVTRNHDIRTLLRESVKVYSWYTQRRKEGYEIALLKDGKYTHVDLGYIP